MIIVIGSATYAALNFLGNFPVTHAVQNPTAEVWISQEELVCPCEPPNNPWTFQKSFELSDLMQFCSGNPASCCVGIPCKYLALSHIIPVYFPTTSHKSPEQL